MGLTGWKLFTQDHCARLKNEIEGVAVPSILHRSLVGRLQVESPAEGMVVAQYHPSTYWISKKVVGYDRREPVKVVELVSLPLTLAVSYRSNLTAVAGKTPRCRIYADVVSLYQGQQLHNELEISFDLVSGWKRQEITLNATAGIVNSYALYIQLENVTGWLEFDNVRIYHNGQNWARDPWCNDINQTFTKVYFQVPKHWAGVDIPDGTFYESVYPVDEVPATPVLLDSYDWANFDSGFAFSSNILASGQTVKPSQSAYLTSAQFRLRRGGSPVGALVCRLYAITGTSGVDGKPTGPILAQSASVDVASVSDEIYGAPLTFTFDGTFRLQANVDYALAVYYADSDYPDTVWIYIDSIDASHPGNFINYGVAGAQWYPIAGWDTPFTLYGVV